MLSWARSCRINTGTEVGVPACIGYLLTRASMPGSRVGQYFNIIAIFAILGPALVLMLQNQVFE